MENLAAQTKEIEKQMPNGAPHSITAERALEFIRHEAEFAERLLADARGG